MVFFLYQYFGYSTGYLLGHQKYPKLPSGIGYLNPCYAQCPPSTVTIQPPPFVLTIPGPSICCPYQPFGIVQNNPCDYSYGGVSGGRAEALSYSGSSISNLYSRRALPRSTGNYGSCWPY
uniref:Uncharacterized protein n=1 Tax=Sphenodon punctatus TaxID=8508 RepID=A0A8D0H8C9_SPHPU